MKQMLFLCAAAMLAAGCATTEPTQLTQADCKVHPITTTSVTGARRTPSTSLEQRQAEAQLATSDFRRAGLAQNGYNMNNVEDALRDCNAK